MGSNPITTTTPLSPTPVAGRKKISSAPGEKARPLSADSLTPRCDFLTRAGRPLSSCSRPAGRTKRALASAHRDGRRPCGGSAGVCGSCGLVALAATADAHRHCGPMHARGRLGRRSSGAAMLRVVAWWRGVLLASVVWRHMRRRTRRVVVARTRRSCRRSLVRVCTCVGSAARLLGSCARFGAMRTHARRCLRPSLPLVSAIGPSMRRSRPGVCLLPALGASLRAGSPPALAKPAGRAGGSFFVVGALAAGGSSGRRGRGGGAASLARCGGAGARVAVSR